MPNEVRGMVSARGVDDPVRDRTQAALDMTVAALRRLLTVVDLVDGNGGCNAWQYQSAKDNARKALDRARTLVPGTR